jgi:DNA-binding MarR family transcriptional regulator
MPGGSVPSILMELHTADRVVRTLVYEELYRRGLAPNLLSILVLIDLHEPITPTELAVESGLRPTTLRDLVGQMIDRGHVTRRENPDDRRSHFLVVTSAGRRFIADSAPALATVQKDLEARLGASLESMRPSLTALRRAARDALQEEEPRIRGA